MHLSRKPATEGVEIFAIFELSQTRKLSFDTIQYSCIYFRLFPDLSFCSNSRNDCVFLKRVAKFRSRKHWCQPSEMGGRLVTRILGSLLWGISVYGCLSTDPLMKPFGYLSFVMAKSHGMHGMLTSLRRHDRCGPESARFGKLMDCVQLTLFNSELYEQTQELGRSILYGMCITPLIHTMAKDPNQKLWKCLLTFYNCSSLTVRANNESNWLWIAISGLHFISVEGIDYLGRTVRRAIGKQIAFVARIIVTYLAVQAINEKG